MGGGRGCKKTNFNSILEEVCNNQSCSTSLGGGELFIADMCRQKLVAGGGGAWMDTCIIITIMPTSIY